MMEKKAQESAMERFRSIGTTSVGDLSTSPWSFEPTSEAASDFNARLNRRQTEKTRKK